MKSTMFTFAFLVFMLEAPAAQARAITWIHADGQGSIRGETDAGGNLLGHNTYRPFGDAIDEIAGESRGYTGQRQDGTGLIYLHARYFDPQLSRFVSPDPTIPTAAIVGLNRYAYAQNDPVNRTDIDGYGDEKKTGEGTSAWSSIANWWNKQVDDFAKKLKALGHDDPGALGAAIVTGQTVEAVEHNIQTMTQGPSTGDYVAGGITVLTLGKGALATRELSPAHKLANSIAAATEAAANNCKVGTCWPAGYKNLVDGIAAGFSKTESKIIGGLGLGGHVRTKLVWETTGEKFFLQYGKAGKIDFARLSTPLTIFSHTAEQHVNYLFYSRSINVLGQRIKLLPAVDVFVQRIKQMSQHL